MVENINNEKDAYTWKVIHNDLVNHIQERPHFTPSGRLKAKQKIDYRLVIENASRSMIRFKKPERLIRMIVRVITEQVGVDHAGVLLHNEKNKAYVLIDSKGVIGKKIPVGYIRIPEKNALIATFDERRSLLLDERGVLTYDNLKAILKDKDLLKKNNELKERINKIRKEMELISANVCIPAYFKRKLLGILVLGPKISHRKFDRDEIGFFVTLANDAAMAITNAQLIENLQEKIREVEHLYEKEHRLFIHTSIALAAAIDARDPYTAGHTARVTHYSLSIADELEGHKEIKQFNKFKEDLHISALLHDIGKIGIRDNILNKKRDLTKKERVIAMKHPEIGAAILRPIRELGNIIDGVKYHQERYDGKGYPEGLKGSKIPLMARIISIADTFDAMTTDRPYRKKRNIVESIQEIKKNSGTQFDPKITEAFLRAYKKGKLV
ncbi:MAG: HD domain-containing protein [Candidatus Omnitrophica bacterium]|nr:HD domain-containing protein [Candidatus Omnitrophota bacterium]